MAGSIITFQTEGEANALIAGIPAAVRSFEALDERGAIGSGDKVVICSAEGWQGSASLHMEFARLHPGIDVGFVAGPPPANAHDGLTALGDGQSAQEIFRKASRAIIATTGKPTDGLVSRYLNRPISQFLSLHLLRLRWIRPIHATIATSLIGLAMALCLFFGGTAGLMLGAILFQLASILDGVDGEIARATRRSSKLGATLDTAGDAATNFAFIAGVCASLWQQGHIAPAQIGFAGLGLLIAGLTIIGTQSVLAGGPLSFDALKHEAKATASPVLETIARLTSRDVYALVLAVLILMGLTAPAMVIFAGAATIWFAFVIFASLRGSRPR
ncbi:MAG: CDP-alcohol phosphatidyltransferase family protein [Pseudomonadota bacterium]|nr:CDP-alcohol phosphatidyltransferase family protein [Pseudomonadota bacterium]